MTALLTGAEGAPAATPAAAWARLQAVRPSAYARTRNHLDGAVTGLSPWITHGVLTVPEVVRHLHSVHRLPAGHKLLFELGWREYFRHVWDHLGDDIGRSRHEGPLPEAAYAREMPVDVREARTGLPVIDEAVRTLYATGTLHNHARMWLASWLVHGRKLHWRTGADWLYGHLLDGDLASNLLSWQWVAGTGSHQPYLFDATNVRRHAPPGWWVDGTLLDRPRGWLDAVARDPQARLEAAVAPPKEAGVDEPPCSGAPPAPDFGPVDAAAVQGRDVWLVHPWCLADPPPGTLPVAVLDRDFHARWPWSRGRWHFVLDRQRALARVRWCDGAPSLVRALQAARSVGGRFDPHLDASFRTLPLAPEPRAFVGPVALCRSFSGWWAKARRASPAEPAPEPCRQAGALPCADGPGP